MKKAKKKSGKFTTVRKPTWRDKARTTGPPGGGGPTTIKTEDRGDVHMGQSDDKKNQRKKDDGGRTSGGEKGKSGGTTTTGRSGNTTTGGGNTTTGKSNGNATTGKNGGSDMKGKQDAEDWVTVVRGRPKGDWAPRETDWAAPLITYAKLGTAIDASGDKPFMAVVHVANREEAEAALGMLGGLKDFAATIFYIPTDDDEDDEGETKVRLPGEVGGRVGFRMAILKQIATKGRIVPGLRAATKVI